MIKKKKTEKEKLRVQTFVLGADKRLLKLSYRNNNNNNKYGDVLF